MKKKLIIVSMLISFYGSAQNNWYNSPATNTYTLFGDIGIGILADDILADLHIVRTCIENDTDVGSYKPYIRFEMEKDYKNFRGNYPNNTCIQDVNIDYNERWDIKMNSKYLWFENSSRLRSLSTQVLYLSKLGTVGVGNEPPVYPRAKLYVAGSILISDPKAAGGFGIVHEYDDPLRSKLIIKPQNTVSPSGNGSYKNFDECLSVTNSGQLVIGRELLKTSEHFDNYKMSVFGKIVANEFVVVPLKGNWADYVFEDGYKFLSVSELEDYIRLNKHLPGVPAQAEIEGSGYNLAEMNVILLEKIEELTLYLIAQQKEIEKCNHEINEMKVQLNAL